MAKQLQNRTHVQSPGQKPPQGHDQPPEHVPQPSQLPSPGHVPDEAKDPKYFISIHKQHNDSSSDIIKHALCKLSVHTGSTLHHKSGPFTRHVFHCKLPLTQIKERLKLEINTKQLGILEFEEDMVERTQQKKREFFASQSELSSDLMSKEFRLMVQGEKDPAYVGRMMAEFAVHQVEGIKDASRKTQKRQREEARQRAEAQDDFY